MKKQIVNIYKSLFYKKEILDTFIQNSSLASQKHNIDCKVFAVAFFGGNAYIGYLCKVQISQAEDFIFCLLFTFRCNDIFY